MATVGHALPTSRYFGTAHHPLRTAAAPPLARLSRFRLPCIQALVAVQCSLNSVDAGDGLPAAVTCEHGHCCFARAAAGSLIGLRPLAYISRDSPTVASFRFTLLLPAARGASTPQPAGHSPACTLLPASRPDSCSPKVAASSVGPRPRLVGLAEQELCSHRAARGRLLRATSCENQSQLPSNLVRSASYLG